MDEGGNMAQEMQSKKNQTDQKVNKVALGIAAAAGVILLAVIAIGVLDAIQSSPEQSLVTEEEINANCTAAVCMEKIEITDGVDKITEVIGVEPEVDEENGSYKWKISSKESITREKSGESYSLSATVDNTTIKGDTVDLSVFSDLRSELQNGETVTYDDLVKRLNGVEGVAVNKAETSNLYKWVDKNGQALTATIRNKDGICTIIALR